MEKEKKNLGKVILHKRTQNLYTIVDEDLVDDAWFNVIPYGTDPNSEENNKSWTPVSRFGFSLVWEWTDKFQEITESDKAMILTDDGRKKEKE